jgi:hypothetical protein
MTVHFSNSQGLHPYKAEITALFSSYQDQFELQLQKRMIFQLNLKCFSYENEDTLLRWANL